MTSKSFWMSSFDAAASPGAGAVCWAKAVENARRMTARERQYRFIAFLRKPWDERPRELSFPEKVFDFLREWIVEVIRNNELPFCGAELDFASARRYRD